MFIRFYNDCQARAVWDEEHSKWRFSDVDIVRVINDEADYAKTSDYQLWLKKKLNAEVTNG